MPSQTQNGGRQENGDKSRVPLEVELLGDDGQPTAFLRNAPFLDFGSPMTALERCASTAATCCSSCDMIDDLPRRSMEALASKHNGQLTGRQS